MRIYVDTNVWLDLFRGRKTKYLPMDEFAASIFARVESGEFEIVISDHLMDQLEIFIDNHRALNRLLATLEPHTIKTRANNEDKRIAQGREGEFEDMLHYAIAQRCGCEYFITGDKGLYFPGPIKIVSSKDI